MCYFSYKSIMFITSARKEKCNRKNVCALTYTNTDKEPDTDKKTHTHTDINEYTHT